MPGNLILGKADKDYLPKRRVLPPSFLREMQRISALRQWSFATQPGVHVTLMKKVLGCVLTLASGDLIPIEAGPYWWWKMVYQLPLLPTVNPRCIILHPSIVCREKNPQGFGQILYGPQTIGGVSITLPKRHRQKEPAIKIQGGSGNYYNALGQYGNRFWQYGHLCILFKRAQTA